MTAYAEPVAATNFSFLRGASPGSNLVMTALLLGQAGLGIADRNTVAGVVRAWSALRDLREDGVLAPEKIREGGSPGEYIWVENPAFADLPFTLPQLQAMAKAFKLATGSRLVFADGTPDIVVYPANRAGWGRLCRLLTSGNLRGVKGECILSLDDLLNDARDLLLIVMPERRLDGLAEILVRLDAAAPGAVWLSASMSRRGDDRRRLARLKSIAAATLTPLIATNDVLYDAPEQRDLQDLLTCIREGTTIDKAGRLLEANAERHLKAPQEMTRLFKEAPEAITETQHLFGRIDFDLGELRYEYPDEPVPPGWTPQGWLEELVRRRLPMRYPGGIPQRVQKQVDEELVLIGKLDYARYFLTIRQIVEFAESQGILCQGRGSAANSAVCYALGITAVDPDEHTLLFARFISEERREPPDIDVDFEHERREEVIQWIYQKYGRHRAGIAATVIHYRPRSAMREAGKALGLTEDVTARLASTQWGSWGSDITRNQIRQAGLDPDNPVIAQAVRFAVRLLGFPRHLSQHVGGFVLMRGRLDETVPIGNAAMADRTFIEWDRDDIDALRLMKVDVLALGMLTCIRKAFDLLREHESKDYGLAEIPQKNGKTYDMLCEGKSIGVFQVESRAQINMLPRLRPREFYDLVIQVAIVRPGPIQGNMVHPYLKRRAGIEEIDYPSPAPPHDPDELRHVLDRTLGVPLFQEQAMTLAMVAAEFTDPEANGLRRAMATFRNVGTIGQYEAMMVERMVARGYERDFAQRCFEQIKGFGSYGFPESHAASFAKLVYVSSWLKCHHPAIFAAALLNSQPMGFYAPAQIVREAQENGGVEPRPIDVNSSAWDNLLEAGGPGWKSRWALRLGLRQLDGFKQDWAERLVAARAEGYHDVEGLARRACLPARAMRLLADADAFRSIGLDRREALWAVRRLPDDEALPLFEAAQARELGAEQATALPAMPLAEHVVADYQTARLSLKGHPMGLLRPRFVRERIASCEQMSAMRDGTWTSVAGVVLVRQRPGKGNAIFITLEDETGITNVVLWARDFERFRREVMAARLLLVEGRVQKSPENVIHLMAKRVVDRSADLLSLSDTHRAEIVLTRADEFQHPQIPRARHPRNVRILPKSRDFH
ncbi:Error-prone DNA polymerase [Bosea sp. 62]|uniref:error-prone DNA polymerase n=1 Tax=unclassified Bosea (in: a-proteobacteria) TaxID=2653178 RepID=UPI001258B01B|nr:MULTISPECIES: error-prone DNA polymerase [unclassified Bosea (in: a-proteobacteria)]CAD5295969.1 Error-prone DNA polymerase [Bosea sp. 21B]CAD5296348.1 Error-prone DNA polymerase [Bosea sp. 46]CAD5297710.1 Error-prone DNA polymerase [Bosea sp. 7B]VVT61077.1 Error-prone DNA polymerase [Bosea sp. EC-HK365B]VXB13726.1 Error-prone DNA polymerase [Bosea sp. 125]